jgi:hypothetical protein
MQHTPGPWQWFERTPGRPYLATPDRGQLYVLGFERKGMQGAGPVFAHWPGIEGGAPRERKGGIMQPGLLMRDGSMHPDAKLIEDAPDLLAALQAAECLFACRCNDATSATWLDRVRELLHKHGAA